MDFARKQLEKYGWTDGKGLGKHEDGMAEALKPKLKRSMTGIGHDAAADFTEHWWSALYDKAAGNIEVKEKNGKTKKIKAKDSTGFEITSSIWKMGKKPKSSEETQAYKDFFVRTEVLGSGGVKTERVRESEDEDESSVKDVVTMTDEELFAACGGRTAHKGARHGLKALGKLARIEQQEQLLLQQAKFNGYSHAKKYTEKVQNNEEVVEEASLSEDGDNTVPKKKKKKKKHCNLQNNNENLEIESKSEDTVRKKKKNKDCSNKNNGDTLVNSKMDLEDVGSLLENTEVIKSDCVAVEENEGSSRKKKKLKKDTDAENRTLENGVENGTKKKNAKNIDMELESEALSIDGVKPKKKRKQKEVIDVDWENCDLDITSESKKSKKRKKKET